MNHSTKTSEATSQPIIGRVRFTSMIILVILSAVCLGLLLFVSLPAGSLLWSSVQNLGHFVLFTLLAIVYIVQLEKILHWKFLPNAVLILVVLTIIGTLAETVQIYQPDRNASGDDLWRNFAGMSAGLVIFGCYRNRKKISDTVLALSLILLLSVVVWVSTPAVQLVGYALLKTSSPVVLSFSDPFVNSMISTTGGAKTTIEILQLPSTKSSLPALRMDFALQEYNGVIYHEPEGPWHESSTLKLRVFNGDTKLHKVHLRIHDAKHNNRYEDRFNTVIRIDPGENEILIPVETIVSIGSDQKKRILDTENISELKLFSNTGNAFTLYLLGIELSEK